MTVESIPKINLLPASLSGENAIEIEIETGAMIFRASKLAQQRIENLLLKQKQSQLDETEEQKLEQYEEIDDYQSFLNRLTRNPAVSQTA